MTVLLTRSWEVSVLSVFKGSYNSMIYYILAARGSPEGNITSPGRSYLPLISGFSPRLGVGTATSAVAASEEVMLNR